MRPRKPPPPPAEHAAPRHASEPTLAAVVRERTGATWSRARALCTDGRVTVDGEHCLDAARRVPPGVRVDVDEQGPRVRMAPLPPEAIVHADREIVVVDKPPGMLSVPDEEGTRGTLADHARTLLRAQGQGDTALGVVHRLDRDTSGLVVFARTASAQRLLAAQFRTHDIGREYLAIAHGDVATMRIETVLLPDRGDGLRGSYGHFRRPRGGVPSEGKRAVTHVERIAALAGATLVACRLDTGRQHQIRIHLAEQGHPLVGERVYVRDYDGPRIAAPRTMLHARSLAFVHPRGHPVSYSAEPPEDFAKMLAALERSLSVPPAAG